MKNFVLSVVASLAASILLLAFPFFNSVVLLSVLSLIIGCVLLALTLFVVITRKRSKNPILKLKLREVQIGIMPNYERVICKGVPLLRPNYVKIKRSDGTTGTVHYSQVIIYI